MSTLQANGLTLGYDRFGDARDEAMLLISGLGVQRLRWAGSFCERLAAQGFHVIRFDNRDTGESTRLSGAPVPDFAALVAALAAGHVPTVPYTLHDLATDAIALLNTLGISRAHVVGRSMGGMVAQLLASTHADRVLSLVSIMSSTGHPGLPTTAPDVMAMLMRPVPDPRADEAAFLAHGVAFARRIAGTGFSFDEATHRDVLQAELMRAQGPDGMARQIAAIAATGSLRPLLARVAAPTLVVHGSDDPMIPPACGRDVADHIVGAEFLLVDGMGHDVPVVLYNRLVQAITTNARRRVG
jgi:pimeloyl-ACP methyl ester carboxylesterase